MLIFCGIQASGKSTFYKQNFFNSHLRISLDLLNTRNREKRFLELSFETNQKIVIDNTNITIKERKKYIDLAKEHNYKIIGYYFQSKIKDCIARNDTRTGKEKIPTKGIAGTFGRLEKPSFEEGFEELYFVSLQENEFLVDNYES